MSEGLPSVDGIGDYAIEEAVLARADRIRRVNPDQGFYANRWANEAPDATVAYGAIGFQSLCPTIVPQLILGLREHPQVCDVKLVLDSLVVFPTRRDRDKPKVQRKRRYSLHHAVEYGVRVGSEVLVRSMDIVRLNQVILREGPYDFVEHQKAWERLQPRKYFDGATVRSDAPLFASLGLKSRSDLTGMFTAYDWDERAAAMEAQIKTGQMTRVFEQTYDKVGTKNLELLVVVKQELEENHAL